MQTTVFRYEIWDEKAARFIKSTNWATEESIAAMGARPIRDESHHVKISKLDPEGRICGTYFDGD